MFLFLVNFIEKYYFFHACPCKNSIYIYELGITIKTDSTPNPWGFSTKFLDRLDYANNQLTQEVSLKLKTEFKPILKKIMQGISEKLVSFPLRFDYSALNASYKQGR